eukprot:365430-Chlamydomonas_euryale.AAC.2
MGWQLGESKLIKMFRRHYFLIRKFYVRITQVNIHFWDVICPCPRGCSASMPQHLFPTCHTFFKSSGDFTHFQSSALHNHVLGT